MFQQFMTSSQLNKFFTEVIQRLDASKTFGFDLLVKYKRAKATAKPL
jgi:4-hydroxyphenylpyruvate dioxygenase-like putative hemolysin